MEATQVRLPQRSEKVAGTEPKNKAAAKAKTEKKHVESKIDRQLKDSFPASDPPSFSGGRHIIGAPEERESGAASATDHDVMSAEKKVKDGSVKTPEKY
ncbi:MAG TPA: hypothetical protein VIJ62_08150 [Rhizomicrobium sp.]